MKSHANDDRPTICQVVHSLGVGGAEVLVDRLGRGLDARFRMVFACLDNLDALGEKLLQDGFRVEVLGRRPGIDPGSAMRLAHFVRGARVDIIHAHQYTPFFYAMASRLGRRWPPVLFTEHGRLLPDFPRRKRIAFNRLTLRRHDRVVGVGEAVRGALIANEGLPPARIDVIYNGVDIARFAPPPAESRGESRIELGIPEHAFVIVQVARLDYLKDHLTAVRAVRRVHDALPEVKLLLVGEGPERASIEAEVARLDLENVVRFLGLRRDVERWLHASDLFLLTSISEGIPVTLIEAMAAGLPTVATDVGGVGEVVPHGVTGLLAPPKDDSRVGAAILELAKDPERRRELGVNGRQRAGTIFSEQGMLERYAQYYSDMLT